MTKRAAIAIIFISLIPAIAVGITRKGAIDYALEHSEFLKAAKSSAKVLEHEGTQASSISRPQVNLESGWTEMGNNAPDSPISYLNSPTRNLSAEARLSQMIWTGGRIINSRKLDKNLHTQADLLNNSSKRDIISQTRLAFDSVLYRRAALYILIDRVSQRKAELEDANDLKEAGVVTSLDVRQAKMNLNFAEDERHAGRTAYEESVINFNLIIGKPLNQKDLSPNGNLKKISKLENILYRLDKAAAKDDLIDLKTEKARTEAARLNYEITKGELFPQISVFTSGKTSGDKTDNMNESWNVGVQLNLNIFDGGLTYARKSAAKAQMIKARENLKQTRQELISQIKTIAINIRTLSQRIQLQEEAVSLSEKNYEDARGHYRAGTITLTRFGEFNLSYAEARFNLLGLYFLQWELLTKAQALLEE